MSATLRLVLSILVLIAVFVIGTAGYMVIEADKNLSVFDAAYMTAITLSTVGFNEHWDLSRAAEWWTLGVITFGIAAVSVAFTSLITIFVSGEILSLREQRKMKMIIEQMKDHVIVCGYGRMGTMVARELERRGQQIVVLERSRETTVELHEMGVPYLPEDATEEASLIKAGVERAKALIVTLPHDADNVFITLTAHALNPKLTILARAEQPSTEPKLRRAGASRVVCPPQVGATTLANMLTRPNVVDFVEIADRGLKLEMDEIVISPQSPVAGSTLRDSHLRAKTEAIVVAVKRTSGETIYSPKPDEILEGGDTLIVVGPAGVATRIAELAGPAK